jgi:hypothetical protein
MSDADPDRTRLGSHEYVHARQQQEPYPAGEAGVPGRHPDQNLLRELEPAAERLLNRHLSMAMHHREQFAEAARAVGPLLVLFLKAAGVRVAVSPRPGRGAAVQPAALGGPLSVPKPTAQLADGEEPMEGSMEIEGLAAPDIRECAA